MLFVALLSVTWLLAALNAWVPVWFSPMRGTRGWSRMRTSAAWESAVITAFGAIIVLALWIPMPGNSQATVSAPLSVAAVALPALGCGVLPLRIRRVRRTRRVL
jgi:hypothetical protein